MDYGPLTEFLLNLIYSERQKQELYNRFEDEVNRSMANETYITADLKSYISYIQQMPTGKEKGSYLTLHIGKAITRIALLKLDGSAHEKLITKNFPLTSTLLRINALPFFDHMAQCLNSFLKEHNVRTTYGKLPLVLSLAYEHKNIDLLHAIVKDWPYKTDGFVGCDLGQVLNDALKRRNLEVECVAIVNNTIGTLFSRSRWNACHIGVIVGIGTNACLLEDTKKVHRLEDKFKDKPYVVINYEWAYFGDKGTLNFIRSHYDKEIDDKSRHIRVKILEKMVGSQLMTLVVLQAVKDNVILINENKKVLIKKLSYRKCLTIQEIYDLAYDYHPHYVNARKIMATALEVEEPEISDCKALASIADCLIRRSAIIIGTLLSYLIVRTERKSVIIAVEGEVFRNHINYVKYVNQAIRERLTDDIEFELQLADHGPERGAALIIANAISPEWGTNALKSKVIYLPREKEKLLRDQENFKECNCNKS